MKENNLSLFYYKMLFWLLGSVLLIGVISWEWRAFEISPSESSAKLTSQKTPNESQGFFDELVEYHDSLLPKQDYDNIVMTPLFIEGRVALKHEESSSVQGSSNFKLTGIIAAPSGLLALIQDDKNKQFRVKIGENINGWTVFSVVKGAVELKKDDKIQKILLIEPKKTSPLVSPDIVSPTAPDMQYDRRYY